MKILNEHDNRERKVTEVKVNGKSVRFALNAWNTLLNIVGGVLATIGAISLVHPDLRLEVVTIFNQFLDEIGLFF
ncbi:hypothetical protein SAMN05216349_12340 [Oribacterium sp. KHPX15]|uniref:hypothetical protein n=1 Tax=Oribacterium sp. KHPX15 TaxID=1855342 RepID=UPI0008996D89|nr:hypothetical protein [Oribacterium sp. KHPX15]SEA69884.1 hypothetical protein SAMN05216349_12340 [Oribacterium sp. KHPX15]